MARRTRGHASDGVDLVKGASEGGEFDGKEDVRFGKMDGLNGWRRETTVFDGASPTEDRRALAPTPGHSFAPTPLTLPVPGDQL
jgi:hypothetical protein